MAKKLRVSTQTTPLPLKKKKKSDLLQLTKMQKEGKKPPQLCEEAGEGPVAFSCPWLSGW